jgi:hypothetical protein
MKVALSLALLLALSQAETAYDPGAAQEGIPVDVAGEVDPDARKAS